MNIRRVSLLSVSALLAACGPDAPSQGKPGASGAASVVTLKSIVAERSGANLHLTLMVQVRNPASGPLTLSPPAVQLFAGTNAVEPFIAPGLEPAVIPPGGEAEATTHWWLAAQDLSGPLTLEIDGSRSEVKSARAFALDLLPENRPIPISFPDWKLP